MTAQKSGIAHDQILKALKGVQDPEIKKDLVDLNMIEVNGVTDVAIQLKVLLTTPACPLKSTIEADVKAALAKTFPDHHVIVNWGTLSKAQKIFDPKGLPNIQNVILIGSGKGGVGKSTVATNIALALATLGCKVGLLDADIYGPSAPTMLGKDRAHTEDGKTMEPTEKYGIKINSMGFLVNSGDPIVWRGPMISSALMQLTNDTNWGELDYLIVDLPPGTGDVQLTISQKIKVTGAVLVSTPQDVALEDVLRAQGMFEKTNVPILGMVENMSYFICDGCNKKHFIFGEGGVSREAAKLKLPVLGHIPLETAVREAGDSEEPIVSKSPESPISLAFIDVAKKLAGKASIQNHSLQSALRGLDESTDQPTANV